jgi:hypothetical protein
MRKEILLLRDIGLINILTLRKDPGTGQVMGENLPKGKLGGSGQHSDG